MKKQYILKTVNADMTAHGGFKWPESGPVEAPDWDDAPKCGGGLHGALNGCGDGHLFDWSAGAKWLVFSTASKIVDLGGKIKTKRGKVEFVGSKNEAIAFLEKKIGTGYPVIGKTATAGDGGTATAGDYGTATAGDYGTATVGDGGTATAGYHGTATAGDYGTATAGDGGTATAGRYGTATAGRYGTATAGHCGTAIVGDYGTATAGDGGTATVGDGGTATAGDGGTITIAFYADGRKRFAVGYAGENGIEAGVAYRLNKAGKFVKA